MLQGMVMLILATDMARHSEILESFKAKVDNFDFSSDEHVNAVGVAYVVISYSNVLAALQ